MKKQKQPEQPLPECGDVWLCMNYKTETGMIGARCSRPPGHKPPHRDQRRGPVSRGRRGAVSIAWGWIKDGPCNIGDKIEWTE